jgi:hypothetical protein
MRSPALLQPNPRHPNRLQYRHHYSPQADRLPRWLHRVWAWF